MKTTDNRRWQYIRYDVHAAIFGCPSHLGDTFQVRHGQKSQISIEISMIAIILSEPSISGFSGHNAVFSFPVAIVGRRRNHFGETVFEFVVFSQVCR